MSKRIKSFFISAGSLLGTALITIMLTPEWAAFMTEMIARLKDVGVPASLVAVIGMVVAELWKSILNRQILKKEEQGRIAGSVRGHVIDLY